MNTISYYYLIMAQKDLLENQCLEELLREKTTYYLTRKQSRDFWICMSPKFIYDSSIYPYLKKSQFYQQKKSILSSPFLPNSQKNTFFASVISLDKEFINWLHLRLGYFENIETKEFREDSNTKLKNFVSDGITGRFFISQKNPLINPLKNYSNYIHPDIFLKKNTKFLELYYKNITNNSIKV